MRSFSRALSPRWLLTTACLLLPTAAMLFARERPVLTPREQWTNLFGGQEAVYHFTVRAPGAARGTLGWSLRFDQRTLARGEAPITANANASGTAEIKLRVPEVKEGVMLRTLWSVSLFVPGQDRPQATFERTLWIFPVDPFADRAQWLKERKITLFDPRGKTAEVLQKLKVPFNETRNVAALGELKEGMVLIGEGASWKEDRDLPEAMTRLAARGVPVLCLAPFEGTMLLPGTESGPLPLPRSLSFKRQEAITQLDKRLDATAWPPDGQVATAGIALQGEGASVLGEVVKAPAGWPWVELDYASGGKLVVCGFALIAKWDAGPTPRFLLARIIERMAGKDTDVAAAVETSSQ